MKNNSVNSAESSGRDKNYEKMSFVERQAALEQQRTEKVSALLINRAYP